MVRYLFEFPLHQHKQIRILWPAATGLWWGHSFSAFDHDKK